MSRTKASMKGRPKLPPVSEEMKAWSAALAAEVESWPELSTRVFFGFTALYRRGRMFGALPRTRGMETPNGFAFKIEEPSPPIRMRLQSDSRVGSRQMDKARWFTFEITSNADLHDALTWLEKAYRAGGKARESK